MTVKGYGKFYVRRRGMGFRDVNESRFKQCENYDLALGWVSRWWLNRKHFPLGDAQLLMADVGQEKRKRDTEKTAQSSCQGTFRNLSDNIDSDDNFNKVKMPIISQVL